MPLIILKRLFVLSLLAFAILHPITTHAQHPDIAHAKPHHSPVAKTRIHTVYGRLPLALEPNVGQVDKRVRFLAHTGRGTLFLTANEAVLTMPIAAAKDRTQPIRSFLPLPWPSHAERSLSQKCAVLRMKLIAAQKPVQVAGIKKLPGIINYFRGNDPGKWHTNIPTYREAKFAGIYRGVDMVYYGAQSGKLEYDFVVKPGADPKAIKLAFVGATDARVTPEGDLALQTAAGEVRWQRPVTYQVVKGHRQEVACSYRLERQGGTSSVRFAVARYDARRPLVIDPTLQYSTYLGGSGDGNGDGESANRIVVDGAGNAYIVGQTYSADFPVTQNALQDSNLGFNNGSSNAFITKLNATGSNLIYSTYLGGSGDGNGNGDGDLAACIALDSYGNACVVGATASADFPITAGAYQTNFKGNRTYSGGSNGFVTMLNATGNGLIYSTYLGGSYYDIAASVALDSNGNACIVGWTASTDFPVTPNAYQQSYKEQIIPDPFTGGNIDGITTFVTKLNAAGSNLIYSTYLGGSGQPLLNPIYGDLGIGIVVDVAGNVYVSGYTYSADFPTTPGAYQGTNKAYDNAQANAFVTKLNATGSNLIYSTYLGGSGHPGITTNSGLMGDGAIELAVDGDGNAVIPGIAESNDFPTTGSAYQATNQGYPGGQANAFVTKLNATGSDLIYSTYLGGTGNAGANTDGFIDGDGAVAVTLDSGGNAYLVGATASADFPLAGNAYQNGNNAFPNDNAFVAELDATGSNLIYSTYLGGSGDGNGNGDGEQSGSIAIDNSGNIYVAGVTYSVDFPTTNGAFQSVQPGSKNAFVSKFLFNPLVISNLTDINVTSSGATIQWTTNLNADSVVNYGATPDYGSTASGAGGAAHSVTLAGLSPNTLYYYQASSTGSGYTTTKTGSFLTGRAAPQIVVSGTTFTRSGSDLFVDVTLSNIGTAPAQNIRIIRATLGSEASTGLPVTSPTITAGGQHALVHALHFNAADFPSGTRTVLNISGTYSGRSLSVAMRVSIP